MAAKAWDKLCPLEWENGQPVSAADLRNLVINACKMVKDYQDTERAALEQEQETQQRSRYSVLQGQFEDLMQQQKNVHMDRFAHEQYHAKYQAYQRDLLAFQHYQASLLLEGRRLAAKHNWDQQLQRQQLKQRLAIHEAYLVERESFAAQAKARFNATAAAAGTTGAAVNAAMAVIDSAAAAALTACAAPTAAAATENAAPHDFMSETGFGSVITAQGSASAPVSTSAMALAQSLAPESPYMKESVFYEVLLAQEGSLAISMKKEEDDLRQLLEAKMAALRQEQEDFAIRAKNELAAQLKEHEEESKVWRAKLAAVLPRQASSSSSSESVGDASKVAAESRYASQVAAGGAGVGSASSKVGMSSPASQSYGASAASSVGISAGGAAVAPTSGTGQAFRGATLSDSYATAAAAAASYATSARASPAAPQQQRQQQPPQQQQPQQQLQPQLLQQLPMEDLQAELLRQCLILGKQRKVGSQLWRRYWTGCTLHCTNRLSARDFQTLLMKTLSLPDYVIVLHNAYMHKYIEWMRTQAQAQAEAQALAQAPAQTPAQALAQAPAQTPAPAQAQAQAQAQTQAQAQAPAPAPAPAQAQAPAPAQAPAQAPVQTQAQAQAPAQAQTQTQTQAQAPVPIDVVQDSSNNAGAGKRKPSPGIVTDVIAAGAGVGVGRGSASSAPAKDTAVGLKKPRVAEKSESTAVASPPAAASAAEKGRDAPNRGLEDSPSSRRGSTRSKSTPLPSEGVGAGPGLVAANSNDTAAAAALLGIWAPAAAGATANSHTQSLGSSTSTSAGAAEKPLKKFSGAALLAARGADARPALSLSPPAAGAAAADLGTRRSSRL